MIPLFLIPDTSPPIWHCRCDCGNECDVPSAGLIRGDNISCGCKRKELRKSLIGLTFGLLTVIERVENYYSPTGLSQVQYLCKCSCGENIVATASSLQRGLVSSCGCLRSKGENLVAEFLKEQNIPFKREYSFDNCINKRPLRFDFAIFNQKEELILLIEINGKQHYEPRFFHPKKDAQEIFEEQVNRDKIKQEYCIKNNLNLLVIPYYELNHYKELINQKLKEIEHYEL